MDIPENNYIEINKSLTESLIESIKQLDDHVTINTKLVQYIILLHEEMNNLAQRMTEKGAELFADITPLAEKWDKGDNKSE